MVTINNVNNLLYIYICIYKDVYIYSFNNTLSIKKDHQPDFQTSFSYSIMHFILGPNDLLSIYFSLYMYIVQVHAYVYTRYM